MLSLGGFPPPQCNAIPHNPISQSLPFPNKTNKPHCSFLPNRVTQLGFCSVTAQIRSGLCAFAVKGRRKGGNSLLEVDGFDGDCEEDDDSDDEAVVVPMRDMKNWLENKPPGFGEGKEYDTSIEDKLFEEMEQSRKAQLANLNKLKNNPKEINSNKEQLKKQRVSEAVLSGIRVRLVNLPKKKNIHRDLQVAFKGVPGIVNIIPAVSGNKKTREPICKGIAFVDLRSEDEANRFVQIFSRQSITFGKIQKQIKCEIMNSGSHDPASDHSVDGTNYPPQLAVPSSKKDLNADIDIYNPYLDSWEETVSDEYDSADNEHASSIWKDNKENFKTFSSLSEPSGGDNREERKESEINSPSPKQEEKIQANRKKLVPKKKGEKVSKLSIPASANRLKIKEKALLTGVFSKYGVKAASAVKEQS